VTTIGTAEAHARLDQSTPAVGEVLVTSPPQVEIIFTQELQRITGTFGIDVIDEGGVDVTTADAILDDSDRHIMTVALQPALPAGRYVVEYRQISDEDGHEFEGAYAFYVGREPTPQERALDQELLGQEEDFASTATAEADATGTATAAEPTVPAAATPARSPTPSDSISDDDSGSDVVLWGVILGSIVLILLVAGGFYAFTRRPPT
jgi:methionine-rich copper-binding protein CopC